MTGSDELVQRIDITSTKENAEDLQWTVLRKYSEFYTLETRLTEFHGEFEDLHLPPKASLFTGKLPIYISLFTFFQLILIT